MSLMFVSLQLGQHAVLTLPITAAGTRSRLPKAEQLTPEGLMPWWPSPVTCISFFAFDVFPTANR